jgi:hypothetical protein
MLPILLCCTKPGAFNDRILIIDCAFLFSYGNIYLSLVLNCTGIYINMVFIIIDIELSADVNVCFVI